MLIGSNDRIIENKNYINLLILNEKDLWNIQLYTNYSDGNKDYEYLSTWYQIWTRIKFVIVDLFQLIINTIFFLMRNNDEIEKIIYWSLKLCIGNLF